MNDALDDLASDLGTVLVCNRESAYTAVTALGVMVFDSCVQLFDGPRR